MTRHAGAEEAVLIGGIEAGMRTALVLSGVSSRESMSALPHQPDYVFDSVVDIDPLTL